MCLYVYECALLERWVYFLCCVSRISLFLPIYLDYLLIPLRTVYVGFSNVTITITVMYVWQLLANRNVLTYIENHVWVYNRHYKESLIIERANIDSSINTWCQRSNLKLCVQRDLETMSMVKGEYMLCVAQMLRFSGLFFVFHELILTCKIWN